jgi:hypothetical protein
MYLHKYTYTELAKNTITRNWGIARRLEAAPFQTMTHASFPVPVKSEQTAPVAARSGDVDDAIAHGVEGEIDNGMQIQLAHEIGAMRLRRLHAQI